MTTMTLQFLNSGNHECVEVSKTPLRVAFHCSMLTHSTLCIRD